MRVLAIALTLVSHVACSPTPAAAPQPRAPYDSGVTAIVDGVTAVCASAFEAAALGRRGSDASAAHLARVGWTAIEPLPDGHIPYVDATTQYAQAPIVNGERKGCSLLSRYLVDRSVLS